jgi:prepilin-type N-terminal cleavage/methylation domain-containing protein
MMKNKNESGFSVVELLVVVLVIGVVASLAVPALQKGIQAAENGNTFATMRTIASTQVNVYSQKGRFGRLLEINNLLSNSVGTGSTNELTRGKFIIAMSPADPTDLELKDGYTITATRNVTGEGEQYVYELTEAGIVRQVMP